MSVARPRVVLVHGVGVGPWSFTELAADLSLDHEVTVVHRRGYGAGGGPSPACSLDDQVGDLAALAAGPASFVGVSGGATIVLALALAFPELVRAAVVHEPVIGPLAPDLHAGLAAAAQRLSASSGEEGAVEFVRRLVGPRAWHLLAPAQVADVAARQAVVRAEVPHFLAFAPTSAALGGLADTSLVSSVGDASPGSRHAAAAVVATHTSSSPVVIQGCGHLAQVEAPAALARALRHAQVSGLQGGGRGHQDVLPSRGRDELQADR